MDAPFKSKVQKGQVNLSFLDTLSCSLGGMIVLFFIFATLSHEGARTLNEPDEISDAKQKAAASAGGKPVDSDRPTLHLAILPQACSLRNSATLNEDSNITIHEAKQGYLLLIANPKLYKGGTIDFEGCPTQGVGQLIARRAAALNTKEFDISGTLRLRFNGSEWEKT